MEDWTLIIIIALFFVNLYNFKYETGLRLGKAEATAEAEQQW